MSGGRKATAMAGFVVLGLTPSFDDWLTDPGRRPLFIASYAVALGLIYFGIFAP